MSPQIPNASPHFQTDRDFATQLDSSDPLAECRSRFFIPNDTIYFDGNSLGLMPRCSAEAVQRVVDEWKQRAVDAWFDADKPWIDIAERLGEEIAPLVGAEPDEVIATGTTTLNLHALVGTFYHPEGERTKILADELTFPSDIYALGGQIRLKGLDPDTHLVLVRSDDGRFLSESAIIDMMTPEIAVAVLPSVLYRSAQLLDMERLAKTARERGIVIGFDCSHSVGAMPHYLDEWGVDFATWCSYKYLNGGPGCPAFLYLNRRHFDRPPSMPGWFGFQKDQQFDMLTTFEHHRGARGWQISSPGILSMVPLEESLEVLRGAGIAAIRGKSLRMTAYMMFLLDELLPESRCGFRIGTPREPTARGGHIALEHRDLAPRVFEALADRGVVADLRPPNVVRLCPSPLYNTYAEIWEVVDRLRDIAASISTRT
jgi:kynureninase